MDESLEMTVVGAGQVKRSEWIAALAFLFSASTAVFTGGVVYGQVQSNTARIGKVENREDSSAAQMTDLKVTLAEMKANVQFLADRAREDRDRREKAGVFAN